MVEQKPSHQEESTPPSKPSETGQGYTRATVRAKLPPGVRIRVTIDDLSGQDGKISPPTGAGEYQVYRQSAPTKPAKIITGQSSITRLLSLVGNKLVFLWNNRIRTIRQDNLLFIMTLATYLATRLIGLENFPIYFFTDEAVQSVLASDFLRDGFRNYDKEVFPTFFQNNSLYCLSTSVYAQIIPTALFGKSILVTRGTPALVTLLAAIWVGWILRDIFKIKYWWVGTLVLSATPAWFIHSRTAFEYSMLVTFFAGFLYYYLLYRTRLIPRYLYWSLVMGALAFYSYMPGQIIMVASGALLLIFDFRLHWKQRATSLRALGVLALVCIPLVRFLYAHPDEFSNRLNRYQSYLTTTAPITEKALLYAREYIAGLNPAFWFFPHLQGELPRHIMKGYGHILLSMLPFTILGLWLILKNHWKSGEGRTIIAAVLAAPTGAATIALGISRALVMVIPIAVLSGIGLSYSLEWLIKRVKTVPRAVFVWGLFLFLAAVNYYMLWDALTNGPLWFQDYELNGMQYGASQVFGVVKQKLRESPQMKIDVSPSWTNGADIVARFFLGNPLPIEMRSIEGYIYEKRPQAKDTLFVMIPEEYQFASTSNKFTNVIVERILPYPNGRPGFYFVRLQYSDNFDQILEQEQQARRMQKEADVTINGIPAHIKYSALDSGVIDNIFDGSSFTLIRTMEANPLQIDIELSQPLSSSSVEIMFGGGPTDVTVVLTVQDQVNPLTFHQFYKGVPNPRTEKIDFGSTHSITTVHLEIRNTDTGEPAHVHLWEVTFK